MSHFSDIFRQALVSRIGVYLLLMLSLSACWAPNLEPPATELSRLNTLLIVPVESPPLQVIPDLLEQHLPVMQQYRNVGIPLNLENKRYLNPGNLEIAGLVSRGDEKSRIYEEHWPQPLTLSLIPGHIWMPSVALAAQVPALLASPGVNATVSRYYYCLPMAMSQRSGEIQHWHDAMKAWYAQGATPIDYRDVGQFDAILEVGVGSYRIFEGQTSLQVLLRLIDPATRRIIARARGDSYRVDDAALNSLAADSLAFKQLIARMGNSLLKQVMPQIGLQIGAAYNSGLARQ